MLGEAVDIDLVVPSIRLNGEFHDHYCAAGDHTWKHFSGRHCKFPWSIDCGDPEHTNPQYNQERKQGT